MARRYAASLIDHRRTNAFVLRQGIMRSHVGKIVAVCALSDCILINERRRRVGARRALSGLCARHAVCRARLSRIGSALTRCVGRCGRGMRSWTPAPATARPPAQRALPIRADDARLYVAQSARVSRYVPANRHCGRARTGQRTHSGVRGRRLRMAVSCVWFIRTGAGARVRLLLFLPCHCVKAACWTARSAA